MNISENREAILKEIELKYESMNQKNRHTFRRFIVVKADHLLGLSD
jgi:hypothetical protein